MNITKLNLTNLISKKIGIHKDDAACIIDSIQKIIKDKMSHQNVKISKFGNFKMTMTKERVGRNPKTMETHIIPSQKKIIFNASKKVRGELN